MKAKACWVAKETKKGWRLSLSIGSKDYPVRGLLLGSTADVERATGELHCVLVHSATCKCKDKGDIAARTRSYA